MEEEIYLQQLQILHNNAVQSKGIQQRNAMGEFIVPPGGKALTSLGDCMPGPSDYCPKTDLTHDSSPQYSITGRPQPNKPMYKASPADNVTAEDMVWGCRTITVKGKGKMRPYDISDDAHINDSIGPCRYNVKHSTVGSCGPKWSVSSRHGQGVNAGPPNTLVQPVDTQGVHTPGPDFRPNSKYFGRGTKKSFGSSRKDCHIDGPGPADYNITSPRAGECGPAYSLAKRLPPPISVQQAVNKHSPGPGTYDIGTTIGKAQAYSVSGRHEINTINACPAPNMYSLKDNIFDAPQAPMTYRPFEPAEKPHPAPNRYTVNDSVLEQAPQFSIRKQTRPTFPDILMYPLVAQKKCTPGPGSYIEIRTLSSNDKPKFSIGKRPKTPKNEVPGPNHYSPIKPIGAKNSPAFSMGSRRELLDKKVSPGPAAYNPVITSSSMGHSMTRRPKSSKKFLTPAPNSYELNKGQTNKGRFTGPNVSLKGRASPYVYSGFRSTQVTG